MNPFSLAFREQQQLFLYDWKYLTGLLFQIGGLSTLTARFLVQFFYSPPAAFLLTLSLLALSVLLCWRTMASGHADWHLLPFCLIPALFLGASLSDNSLDYAALIAFLSAQAALLVYSRREMGKAGWGAGLTVLLFFAAGPASLLFAVTALVLDLRKDRRTRTFVRGLSFVVLALLLAAGGVLTGRIATFRDACTPSFYYDAAAKMPAEHLFAWVALPAVVALGFLCQSFRKLIAFSVGGLAAAALFVPAKQFADKVNPADARTLQQCEYLAENARWVELADVCRRKLANPYMANYFNMALAEQGILAEDLFRYSQNGPYGLVYLPRDHQRDERLARLMFSMGNMAAAQSVAFNALSDAAGFHPAMLKLNVQIELMRGAYPVAEKYLNLLAKSLHYRKWASERRRFLNRDDLVEQDPVLGNGRRDFPKTEGFSLYGSPMDELFRILDANPADGKAMQYGLSYLLLSKDINSLYRFVKRYFGTPGLQTLPTPAQEALVFFSEYYWNLSEEMAASAGLSGENLQEYQSVDVDWCRSHGVSAETFRRFKQFQDASLRSGGSAPSGFRETFWHYLLYKEIQHEP